jgi:hypothetical protein
MPEILRGFSFASRQKLSKQVLIFFEKKLKSAYLIACLIAQLLSLLAQNTCISSTSGWIDGDIRWV